MGFLAVMRKAKAASHVVCPCCALATPGHEMRVWREKGLCRQLAVLDPRPGQGVDDEQWVSGPYRYYYVTHEHRVCRACHAHLETGGQFANPLRNRGKMAFLVLMAILVAAIACLPILIPALRSALWLLPGEN